MERWFAKHRKKSLHFEIVLKCRRKVVWKHFDLQYPLSGGMWEECRWLKGKEKRENENNLMRKERVFRGDKRKNELNWFGKDEVSSSNLLSSSRKFRNLNGFGTFLYFSGAIYFRLESASNIFKQTLRFTGFAAHYLWHLEQRTGDFRGFGQQFHQLLYRFISDRKLGNVSGK